MTENNTEKSRWPVMLRALAMVLAAVLVFSLVMPSVTGALSSGNKEETGGEEVQGEEAQTHSPAEGFELLADLAITEERYQDAAGYLERVLELSEGLEAEALSRLCLKTASVYVMCGNTDRATQLLDRTLELNEASLEALLLKAQLALEAGDSLVAMEALERYVELAPEDLNTRLSLARLYESLNDYPAAVTEYELLYEKQSGDESHYLNALRCSFLAGNQEEAMAKFDGYLEQTGQDSDYYPVALFLRAACVMQLGRLDEAEEGFRQAIDFGYDKDACMEQIALCCFERGDYQQTADYAVELLETEARLNTPELVYQRLGASMMMLERYEEAVKYLDEAKELGLELTGNAYYRGVSLLALHRYDEAAADFGTSIEQGFLTQFCYYNRGVCYVQLLDYEKAALDMEMTLTSGQDPELIEAAREILLQIEEYNKSITEMP